MKKIFLTAMIVTAMIYAKAQSKGNTTPIKFNGGIELGLPVGDFGDISSFGIGASLMGEYAATEQVGITFSVGYLSFLGKSIDLGGLGSVKVPATSDVPLLVGVKYYFTENVYGHLQAGLSIFNNDLGSAFTYAPAIGTMVSEKIDLSLKYQAATKDGGTLSFLGVRAAYIF